MALGASRNGVLKMVVREGMWLASVGLLFGTFIGLGLARVVSSQFVGISGNVPTTYIGALLLLGGAALVAAYIPARLAAGFDPAETLRYE
jgi:ABC-type antimicrobial peptide transport system permease subunit